MDEAIKWLEKANADLTPELMTADFARDRLAKYARAEKLAAFGRTLLARKLDDAAEIARAAGTSLGKAKATVEAAAALGDAGETRDAFRKGDISLDQASEIAKAEQARPGSAAELLDLAGKESFHVLKDKARRVVSDAEQYKDLGPRQRAARSGRSYTGELGMVHINLALEPHVGAPIVNRAEAEAGRLRRTATKEGTVEPFERYLADAYAALLAGTAAGRPGRAEMVVVVSHEVAKRGWSEVKQGETCKIPGVGPVPPEKAKEIAADAFLTGVFYDGVDLRHLKRWTRNTPVEVRLALRLGEPPDFDGIRCADCGNRFGTQNDHVLPHVAKGPASTGNLEPRCRSCHDLKTAADRKAGKLRPPDGKPAPPGGKRAPPPRG